MIRIKKINGDKSYSIKKNDYPLSIVHRKIAISMITMLHLLFNDYYRLLILRNAKQIL